METVSWDVCQEFCKKAGLSLPTEAQWEYACRAGQPGPFSGTGNLDDMGWYKDSSGRKVHPVGEKKPNQFGLYDMHGNVWEWCQDIYDGEFYSKPEATRKDPVCTSGTERRMVRGGGWDAGAQHCRSAERGFVPSRSGRARYLGFRPAAPSP